MKKMEENFCRFFKLIEGYICNITESKFSTMFDRDKFHLLLDGLKNKLEDNGGGPSNFEYYRKKLLDYTNSGLTIDPPIEYKDELNSLSGFIDQNKSDYLHNIITSIKAFDASKTDLLTVGITGGTAGAFFGSPFGIGGSIIGGILGTGLGVANGVYHNRKSRQKK